VDFNGDGVLDVVGGQFGGFVYLIPGLEQGGYAEPVKLENGAGEPIDMGTHWDDAKKQWVTRDGGGEIGLYHLAVDWDGDGDLDLLTGGYSGGLAVLLNEGTREQPNYASDYVPVSTASGALTVEAGMSPAFVDWDGDGLPDLVCADSKGTIRLFLNVGKRDAPTFDAGRILLERAGLRYLKVAVGDLNGDGTLDLVYGAQGTGAQHPVWVMYGKPTE
jgi:hypothetical protein